MTTKVVITLDKDSRQKVRVSQRYPQTDDVSGTPVDLSPGESTEQWVHGSANVVVEELPEDEKKEVVG